MPTECLILESEWSLSFVHCLFQMIFPWQKVLFSCELYILIGMKLIINNMYSATCIQILWTCVVLLFSSVTGAYFINMVNKQNIFIFGLFSIVSVRFYVKNKCNACTCTSWIKNQTIHVPIFILTNYSL